MTAIDLDKEETYRIYDPHNMRGHIQDISSMCRQAWLQSATIPDMHRYRNLKHVVILGMGGSAIGGDLLAGLALPESRVSFTICRGYDLPAFVDDDTLVIASSYSGTTEETVNAFRQACALSCPKLVITSGGEIGRLAAEYAIPIFPVTYLSPPRAAVPLNFIALIAVMQRFGLISDKTADVEEAIELLSERDKKYNVLTPSAENEAKRLALTLNSRLIVVYGAEFLSEVAHRWKGQFNENAETWAFYAALPEMNHLDVMGYHFPEQVTKAAHIVMLRSNCFHPRIQRRYQTTAALLESEGIEHTTIAASGRTRLAQMMELIQLGDYTSYYLALLNGIDPYPIRAIDSLKSKLGQFN